MFGLFSDERESGTHLTLRDEASDTTTGTFSHRHRWILPNFSRGVAVRRDVRGQRFASTAVVQRARKEGIRHFSVVKCFVEDIGVSRACRTDNGIEYSNSMFVDFGNGFGLRREFSTPYTPQQNGPIESAILRSFLRLDTRRDLEFRGCTRTSAWKRSVVAPTLQERAFGWNCYSRHQSASIRRQQQ